MTIKFAALFCDHLVLQRGIRVPVWGWTGLAVIMAAMMTCNAQTPAADERGLWQVWAASTNAGGEHAAVVASCKAFRDKAPQDPLGCVAAGLEAWHLLKMGDTNEAIALFEPLSVVPANATYLQKAGAEMARSWLTRLDREKVRIALKKIYAKNIEFPPSLEVLKTLKPALVPALTDRWGKPWVYRLESPIKGMTAQQYVLESAGLGGKSDLAKMLALPYAGQITLDPVRLSPVSADTIEFATPDGKSSFLQEGGGSAGITFAYLGTNLIVLSDGNHWRVEIKPQQ